VEEGPVGELSVEQGGQSLPLGGFLSTHPSGKGSQTDSSRFHLGSFIAISQTYRDIAGIGV